MQKYASLRPKLHINLCIFKKSFTESRLSIWKWLYRMNFFFFFKLMTGLLFLSFFSTDNILVQNCFLSWDFIHNFSTAIFFKRFSVSDSYLFFLVISREIALNLVDREREIDNLLGLLIYWDPQSESPKPCKSVWLFLLFVQLEADLALFFYYCVSVW